MGQLSRITGVEQCYAHAIAIEHEAVQRYNEFADMTEALGNTDTARLFRQLAKLEAEHEMVLERRARGMTLPALTGTDHAWLDAAAPEKVDHDIIHHLLTPWHALKIAEDAELRARAFFEQVAADTSSDDVRTLALEMAREEAEHVQWIDKLLARTPPPPAPDQLIPSAFFD